MIACNCSHSLVSQVAPDTDLSLPINELPALWNLSTFSLCLISPSRSCERSYRCGTLIWKTAGMKHIKRQRQCGPKDDLHKCSCISWPNRMAWEQNYSDPRSFGFSVVCKAYLGARSTSNGLPVQLRAVFCTYSSSVPQKVWAWGAHLGLPVYGIWSGSELLCLWPQSCTQIVFFLSLWDTTMQKRSTGCFWLHCTEAEAVVGRTTAEKELLGGKAGRRPYLPNLLFLALFPG